MKKLLLCVVLALSLISLAPAPADCRDAYCDTALMNCANRCREFWLGIQVAVDGCVGGCFVGYLFC